MAENVRTGPLKAMQAGMPPPGPGPPMPPEQWDAYCDSQLYDIQKAVTRRKAIAQVQVEKCVDQMRAIRHDTNKAIVKPEGKQSYFGGYFQDHSGTCPPETELMKDCRASTRKIIEALEDTGWTRFEDRVLTSIVQPLADAVREDLVQKGVLEERLLDPHFLPPPEKKNKKGDKQQQAQADEAGVAEKRRAERKARAIISDYINWNEVVEVFHKKARRQGQRRRTRPEVRQHWENKLWTIEEWTRSEAKRLVELATHKYKERQWVELAREMDTGHTPLQCMRLYERTCKANNINTQDWSEAEDKKLLEGISMHSNNWLLVADHVETRTHMQCRHRYDTLLTSQRQRPWSHEEDIRLALTTRAFLVPKDTSASQLPRRREGTFPWQEVAKHMPDRFDTHCRVRWDVIDPKKNREAWTDDELKRLKQAVARCGDNDWVEVAKMIGNGRTRTQCRNAYMSSLSSEARKKLKKKNALRKRYSVVKGKRVEGLLTHKELRSIVESKGSRRRVDSSGSEVEEEQEEEEEETGSASDSGEDEEQYEGSSGEEEDDDDQQGATTLTSLRTQKRPPRAQKPPAAAKAPRATAARPPRAPRRPAVPPGPPPPPAPAPAQDEGRRSVRTSRAPARFGREDEEARGTGRKRRRQQDEDEDDEDDEDDFVYGWRPSRGRRRMPRAGDMRATGGGAGAGTRTTTSRSEEVVPTGRGARGRQAASRARRGRGGRGGGPSSSRPDEEDAEQEEGKEEEGEGEGGSSSSQQASQGPPKKRHKQTRDQQQESEGGGADGVQITEQAEV